MSIDWSAFWPSFQTALAATLKVVAIGLAGFYFYRRNWLGTDGMQVLSRLVAYLTLPCLVFYRFATSFDPEQFPGWWKFVLIGLVITVCGLLLGKLTSLRHGGNDEATVLIGFQNAGFFVLPMLQALLPDKEFARGALMLFMLVIPFNASLWFAGNWFLLHKKSFNAEVILTPPFCSTVISLSLYGFLHDWMHGFNETLPMLVLLGDSQPGGDVGAIQLLGDLTIPLATFLLGASIAHSLRGPLSDLTGKRAALEVTFVKMMVYPLIGYGGLQWLGAHSTWIDFRDPVIQVLIMLQFASPPAVALSVFAQQNDYKMKFIPLTCLVSYMVCIFTVPFWVAMVK